MNDIILVYKKVGQTPLQAIDQLRIDQPELANESITYAGRLDPMAEGLLILLKGEALQEKNKYLHLDKTYRATIMFGFYTDTFDILGLADQRFDRLVRTAEVAEIVNSFVGEHEFILPAFSSPPVNGKPLFQWARENRLNEIELPKRKFNIYNIEQGGCINMAWPEVETYIQQSISSVIGDFRQQEILARWAEVFAAIPHNQPLQTITLTIHCASGTYIRSLANELGKQLGIGAILLKLIRTKVGQFSVTDISS